MSWRFLSLLCCFIGPTFAVSFEEQVLQASNEMRARHGAPPLQLDATISNFSAEYAKTILAKNAMEHSKNPEYGENLYYYSNSDKDFQLTGDMPVKSWYSEIKDYNFKTGTSKGGVIGHFTQLVWKGSSLLGVGKASKDGTYYVVCNYKPPGNVKGKYTENVQSSSRQKQAPRSVIISGFLVVWLFSRISQ